MIWNNNTLNTKLFCESLDLEYLPNFSPIQPLIILKNIILLINYLKIPLILLLLFILVNLQKHSVNSHCQRT